MDHLDELTEGQEPEFYPVDSSSPGLPRVTCLIYRDAPEPGLLTAFTYGVSLADHDLWRHGKPELSISVRSSDERWGLALAYLAEQLRGDCPFAYSNTINLGQPIAPGSPMEAFVIFAPATLDRAASTIDVGEDHPVNVQGAYPVHRSEREFILENGLEAFWGLDWDPYDVTRPPVV